jgi:glycosyltransferase involved in cell wall biosynthesis
MNTILHMTTKSQILVDLKPALDGYAGIPQESRLLFRGFRMLDQYEIDGLIQHGGRRLKAAITPKGKRLSVSRQVNKLSKVIVSLHENPYSNALDEAIEAINHYFARALIRLGSYTGHTIHPGVFETDLFDDFVWRTFFAKTLKPSDKHLVTSARYRVLHTSRNLMHKAGLAGLRYSSVPRYPRIDTKEYDFFLAQTPFPGRVSKQTQLVVRYHDAVPVLMPHTISDKAFHQASHFHALQENVRAGAWFSCISEATRNDLLKIFPEAESRSSVIHNIVSHEYFDEPSSGSLVSQIIRNRLSKIDAFTTSLSDISIDKNIPNKVGFDYLLMVSTIEPRKNHLELLGAWERLKYTTHPDLKLVVVGNLGWDCQPVLDKFRPWAERGDLYLLSAVPSAELRVLYKHATATICPSLAEGFDYAGIEAMRSGGIVISSDIPVHREIYGDASEYFNPYSTEDAAMVIQKVLSNQGNAIKARLRERGVIIGDRYTPMNILPQWEEFFRQKRQNR